MQPRIRPIVLPTLLLAVLPTLSAAEPTCAHHTPERQPFFGDLHVHTALSLDAATQGTRTRPADAYAFAQGAALGIQPFTQAGEPTRTLQLARPLDFAAVTDHAELMGEVAACTDPIFDPYLSLGCKIYRAYPRITYFWMNTQSSLRHRLRLCGPDRVDCKNAQLEPWAEVRAAANAANEDTGSCGFTAFVGYEWTGMRSGGNIHRNVIFATDSVPDQPIDFYAAGTALDLHTQLRDSCTPDTPSAGCAYVVIPHNGNLANDTMWTTHESDGRSRFPDAEAARRWAEAEPIVEVMQHKGQSECWPGSTDEQCSFEALPYSTFPDKYLPGGGPPPADAGFAREVLARGLRLESELGDNPFLFGFIGSTDTHLGAPGAASETEFTGHGGAGKPAKDGSIQGLVDELEFNPGGLAGVWAEENTRASLFAALQRREVFATSGPRMAVRLFADTQQALPGNLCEASDRATTALAEAHPMGARLPASAQPVTLFVEANADPQGGLLQRIQVVRVTWENGQMTEEVVDVAGDQRGAVDPATCASDGAGFTQLCATWTDPTPPQQAAAYYARVLETPSCRWSQHACRAAGVDCSKDVPRAWSACCDAAHQPVIQERAWSSPVWWNPT